ncbi:uncharacterized protein LOC123261859 [Cotesia glomerata]|uniref:uncharacterized protein LOC123261859 n=1 Tax=Cotesia glomerata TaxID=32391 RepID=UPI001D02764C|nr:uncharacterized protein LOC123261859 [Cotesia glomerata]
MSDHDSGSEESAESDNETNSNNLNSNSYYLGKNKTSRWMKKPYSHNKRANEVHVAKVNKRAEKCKTPMDCWELFFDKKMIEDIVHFTNIKLLSEQSKFQRDRDCALTDVIEIRALIGLLYLAGSLKMSRVNLRDIWATDGTSPDYFRCVMSYTRFSLLLRAIRFDDINTRKDRASSDKFAPIREIWEKINVVCQECYSPGQVLTIDEMMSAFRGRCSFKQYMPKKPDKYGLKTFALVDSQSFYVLKMEMYLGKKKNKIDNKPAIFVICVRGVKIENLKPSVQNVLKQFAENTQRKFVPNVMMLMMGFRRSSGLKQYFLNYKFAICINDIF